MVRVEYPAPVRRLTLRWGDGDWEIADEVRVSSMTLPAPDPLPTGDKSIGFWVEATDGQGGVYHREVITDPLLGMEQFEEGGEITRGTHPHHKPTFEVLLPDLPEVTEVHLVSNPAGPPDQSGARPGRTVLTLPRGSQKGEQGGERSRKGTTQQSPDPDDEDGHQH